MTLLNSPERLLDVRRVETLAEVVQLRQRARRIRESAKRYEPDVARWFLAFAAELDQKAEDKKRTRKKRKRKTAD